MSGYVDKSGLFADFNFKLVVIDHILEKHPSFEEALAAVKQRYIDPVDPFAFLEEPLREVVDFFQEVRLTQEDLDKVTDLCFDGGNRIYFLLKPDWDGEEDWFDVASIQGVERLRNLTAVYWTSMCDPELLKPLARKGIKMK